jgi:hypothetical protein
VTLSQSRAQTMREEGKQRTAAGDTAGRRRAQDAASARRRRSSRRRWRPSSPAKIEANRRNGRKSRGPRTTAGKLRSSRNALRHGLAAISRHDPECLPEIERIANALCEGDTDPLLFEQALIFAENDYILRCVRSERLAAIERMRDPTATPFTKPREALARAKARFRQAKHTYEQLLAAKNAATNSKDRHPAPPSPTNKMVTSNGSSEPIREPNPLAMRDEFDAMHVALPDLKRLERYERRGASRRKRAICDFIEIKSRSES